MNVGISTRKNRDQVHCFLFCCAFLVLFLVPVCDEVCPTVCEECQDHFQQECPAHGPPVFLFDTPTVPGTANRAALTVPAGLEVFTESGEADVRCIHETIPKGAIFGPYEGELVSKESSGFYSWMVSKTE